MDKGKYLEQPVRQVLKQNNFYVEDHGVSKPGIDIKAFKDKEFIVAECINWYGGYIHPKRFSSILKSLISYVDAVKFLICAGVKPTEEQSKILCAYGIKIIHIDKPVRNKNECLEALTKGIGLSVVITNSSNTNDIPSFMWFVEVLSCRKEFLDQFNVSGKPPWRISLALSMRKLRGYSACINWIEKIESLRCSECKNSNRIFHSKESLDQHKRDKHNFDGRVHT